MADTTSDPPTRPEPEAATDTETPALTPTVNEPEPSALAGPKKSEKGGAKAQAKGTTKKKKGPGPSTTVSKPTHPPEALVRMNFLWQAASLLQPRQRVLSSHLSQSLHAIGLKSVLRLSPEVKRALCKGCGGLLTAGRTARMSLVGRRRQRRLQVACGACGTTKAFPVGGKKAKTATTTR